MPNDTNIVNNDEQQLQQQQQFVNTVANNSNLIRLPWGAYKEKLISNINIDKKPGEYIMHLLFHNFIVISTKKIEQVLFGDKRVS